jgi:probable rRNA maturation factor
VIVPVYFANRTRGSGLRAAPLRATVDRLLEAVDLAGATVSLTLVRDAEMRALNRDHRAKDAPTDVLSFPLFEPDAFDRDGATAPRALIEGERMLGDIVISIDTAARQAAAYDAPLEREVDRLLIHSVLHLCGHDHMEPGERAVMEREERRLADAIGMPWPYLEGVAG